MDRIKKIKVLLGMVKQEFETAKLADGSEISFDALEINREVYDAEGNPLAEGEYTLEDGTKITVDVNGVIKEIEKADGETEKEEVVEEMAEETAEEVVETTEVVEPETVEPAEPERSVEDRISDLENKVDELYNIILKLTEEQREKEVRIEEIKEEFAAIKANPSASPVFVSEPQNDAPLSRVQRLKDLKSRK